MSSYYVYHLECSDKTLYTGWTNNIEKRTKEHNKGKVVPQGPNDEPASKLLERIKASKEKTTTKKRCKI